MTRTRPALPGLPLPLLLALGLGIGGCQAASDETPVSPATERDVATVRTLTPGDRACYVELEDEQGRRSTAEADFDLCEQPQLIDRRVRLTRERTQKAALSCEGDPECSDTDGVELIISAEPL